MIRHLLTPGKAMNNSMKKHALVFWNVVMILGGSGVEAMAMRKELEALQEQHRIGGIVHWHRP